jgi:UDP-GlcNAc3NAcA epimerase
MKIATIIGARPQFIKAAMVSKAIKKYTSLQEIIIHTGQHFDAHMSDIFFEELQIPIPHYNLNIHGLSHGAMTGQMIEAIEKVLLKEKPDFVMVYGDTNSTIAGALAAKKLHIKVAHVEAGLRSFNMLMPEEINRILTDRISDLLFCPTDTAVLNLDQEGFNNMKCKIVKNGDVMLDAAIFYATISAQKSNIIATYHLKNFVLATIHRAENTDNIELLREIILSLNEINKHQKVVLPLHPRTKAIIDKNKLQTNFLIIEPVGYFDMLELIKNCSLVMTDSGGLQKEAFFFKKHCITLRTETEWTELVDHGFNTIAGANYNVIIEAYKTISNKISDFNIALYGNGNASRIIAEEILNF